MTITVELFRRDLAEVTFRPALWRRLLLRQDTQIRFAVRRSSGWHWDGSGKAVDDERVLKHLRRAADEADFDLMCRQLARAQQDYALDDVHLN